MVECVRVLILRYIKSERIESFTARDYLKVKGLKTFDQDKNPLGYITKIVIVKNVLPIISYRKKMCAGLLRGKFLQNGKAVPTDGQGVRSDNTSV